MQLFTNFSGSFRGYGAAFSVSIARDTLLRRPVVYRLEGLVELTLSVFTLSFWIDQQHQDWS